MSMPFHHALTQAFHVQKNALRPLLSAAGLSPGQPKILYYLTLHSRCMQKDLADFCNIEPATVSRIINNMQKSGLVTKAAVQGNRRAVTINITPKGRKALQRWEEICTEIEQTELAGFSPEEKEAFRDYLSRLYKNFTGRPLE